VFILIKATIKMKKMRKKEIVHVQAYICYSPKITASCAENTDYNNVLQHLVYSFMLLQTTNRPTCRRYQILYVRHCIDRA